MFAEGPAAGQLLAGLGSSDWLGQAPLVALRIELDLEGPGSVAVDAVYPLGTNGLGLPCGFSDVWYADVEVQPMLQGLALGDLLEGESGPSGRIHRLPGLISRHGTPPSTADQNLRQDAWVRVVDDDLVNSSDLSS